MLLARHVIGKVVVGEVRHDCHTQRCLCLEIGQHLGRSVDERLDQRRIVLMTVRQPRDVGDGVVAGIGDAALGHEMVVR